MSKCVLVLLFFVICFGYLRSRATPDRTRPTNSIGLGCTAAIYLPWLHYRQINILYFLDSLCESSLLAKAHQHRPLSHLRLLPRITNDPSLLVRVAGDHPRYPKQVNTSVYVDHVSRDLHRQVCLPNLPRAQSKYNLPFSLDTLHTHDRPQILENENWRTRWTIDAQRIQLTETSVASTCSFLTPTFLAWARLCKRCLPPRAETNRRRR